MNAVVTVAFGEGFVKVTELTLPLMKDYACKVGAEMVVISKRIYPKESPQWEKLQIGRLLSKYERIVFIDADAVVKPGTPDLFQLVPLGRFGAVNEPEQFVEENPPYQKWVFRACKMHGLKPVYNGKYINSGVMVFDRSHARVFAPPKRLTKGELEEQNWINVGLMRFAVPMHFLGREFNWVRWQRLDRDAAHILHFITGPAPKPLAVMAGVVAALRVVPEQPVVGA